MIARSLIVLVLAVVAGALAPAAALGHAVLRDSQPEPSALLAEGPPVVRVTFTESIRLLGREDADVVDENGQTALAAPPQVDPEDASALRLDLRDGLLPGTYTVRWQVLGADSHVIPGAFVFGIDVDELGPPVLGQIGAGPSEDSPWGVSSRVIHLIALGALLGLLAFRWLIWKPVLEGSGARLSGAERTAVLTWGRDNFWVLFGALAVTAMVAEGYLLVVRSATALGSSVAAALADPEGIATVLGDTSFGQGVQIRGALLFVLFGMATWQFLWEYGGQGEPRAAAPAGRPGPAIVMALILVAVFGGLATAGHALLAPPPALQVGAHTVHVSALAVWLGGLGALALVSLRLPRIAPEGGRAVVSALLARLSPVATIAVAAVVVSGTTRALGELSAPAQLWETTYGQVLLVKLALLAPLAAFALYNRRLAATLRRLRRPPQSGLRRMRRAAMGELALSLIVICIAAVLVAQVPGRS